ncbi:MAG: SUMF1/EgtB/PvdO family nonheme iron enzyme [Elusimicrobiota bacterium]|nr:SUMF1/EgtB/PvdO family nonheme iron enzyme [Elusimicrobiota bacterium]
MKKVEAAKTVQKTPGAFFGCRLASVFILAFLFASAETGAADLFPGRGSVMSATISGQGVYGAILLLPAAGATGVSQSPTLGAAALVAGATTQYLFQVDTLPTMDSAAGNPLFSFSQESAQSFAGGGAFSGQDATVSVSSDAYTGISTATFAFYSNNAKLSPDTLYYWRASAKPLGGGWGTWSSTASFTTARFAAQSRANHAAITGVNILSVTSDGLATIGFNIAENNVTTGTSLGNGAYNTADWVFVKYSTQAGVGDSWNHATLTGGTVGAGAALTAATDKRGVFLNHTANSAYWTAGVTLTWDAGADGLFDSTVTVKIFTISMVRIPTGSFEYNANSISYGTWNGYGGDFQATVANAGSLPTGAPAGWPNGYNSFYMGRYEVTQGQYVEYLNTLGSAEAANRNYTGGGVSGQNIVQFSTNPYGSRYYTYTPNNPKAVLPFSHAWPYLSWAGVRPPTEMEFEKAGRDINGDTRRFPWGDTVFLGTNTYTPPNEGGTFPRKYLNFDYNGDTVGQVLAAGRYMSGDVYRTPEETGVSPWGIADLSGSLAEYVFNCSYSSVPSNGNGTVTWPANWAAGWNLPPGVSSFGSTANGIRGGAWFNSSSSNGWNFAVSGRPWPSFIYNHYYTDIGARAVRGP